ncbi:sensor histidine kinase, partial [Streptococcus pyogenes]
SLDRLSGIASIPLKTDKLEQILDKTVTTAFGQDESYRMMTVDISDEVSVKNANVDIQYASILFNTTQIRDSLSQYESTVILVMISFW